MNRGKDNKLIWIYGRHACLAALHNARRNCLELFISDKHSKKYADLQHMAKSRGVYVQTVGEHKIDSMLGNAAVHQGVALRAAPLFGRSVPLSVRVEDIVTDAGKTSTVLLLDEVSDVHNVGAVLRSAGCFDVDAVLLTEHNTPSENSGMAKASSGATDVVPVVCIGNLVKTLDYLKQEGYWCYGFDADADNLLHEVKFSERRVIIMGSEGRGMRNLTKKHCDHLVRIPISEKINSLNVSNAAAIAMYAVALQNQEV
ncbi:23S rRNA (guanosine-2'-O-)-methyltransferase RlmB [Anaplasma platys]|uniref:23S rRNA (Guanosine-2'-O-)-methyltransferase RlmB n=1 Tax=Anaplasma platys TaxID=949 RepID=A0A858PXM1_9RICK|nr:23S rRNA (guanosine(2251)-2'-O)-methyltransferase RlmB [Anaplasma platys]QJC27346.1 23S rRNA (guanosine-2'-O-)-methyltransferase RlmB [Anaplasma platys]